MWFVYLLFSVKTNTTYIGVTNNLVTRLDQHNGLKSGGAKATRKYSDWKIIEFVTFDEKSIAYSFEWFAKHKENKYQKWVNVIGLEDRIKRFKELSENDKFHDKLAII